MASAGKAIGRNRRISLWSTHSRYIEKTMLRKGVETARLFLVIGNDMDRAYLAFDHA